MRRKFRVWQSRDRIRCRLGRQPEGRHGHAYDAPTNQVAATVNFGGGTASVEVFVTPQAVWVTNFYGNAVSHINPQTNKVVGTLSNEKGAASVSYGAGSLWVCDAHSGDLGLVLLDPTTLRAQAQIDTSGTQGAVCLQTVALDHSMWVIGAFGPDIPVLIERVDPTTNKLAMSQTAEGTLGLGLAADAHRVWYLDADLGLFRLDPQTGQPTAQLAVSNRTLQAFSLGAGSVWIVTSLGTVVRITPAS